MCLLGFHSEEERPYREWDGFRPRREVDDTATEKYAAVSIFEILCRPGKCSSCLGIDPTTGDVLLPKPGHPRPVTDDWNALSSKVNESSMLMLRNPTQVERRCYYFIESELDLFVCNNIGLETIYEEFQRAVQHGISSGDSYDCLCGKRFKIGSAFLRHIHGHLKPYVCLICDIPEQSHNCGKKEGCLEHIKDLPTFSYVRAEDLRVENSWENTRYLEEQTRRLNLFAASLAKLYRESLPKSSGFSRVPSDSIVVPTLPFHRNERYALVARRPSSNRDHLCTNTSKHASCSVLHGNAMLLEPTAGKLAADIQAFIAQISTCGFGSIPFNIFSSIPQADKRVDDTQPPELASQKLALAGSEPDVYACALSIQEEFNKASLAAFGKLIASAPSCSLALQHLITLLGNHDELVVRGFASFEQYLSHETLSSLEDVYSFLHIAFAISKTELQTPVESSSEEFHRDIYTLRSCLSDVARPMECNGKRYMYREKVVFDEIVKVMKHEIEHAIAWIGEKIGGMFMALMRSKVEKLQEARDLFELGVTHPHRATKPDENCNFKRKSKTRLVETKVASSYGVSTSPISPKTDGGVFWPLVPHPPRPPDAPTWLDIVTGSVFLIVVGFLQAVREREEFFRFTTDSPYSCLCEPLSSPSAKTYVSPQLQDYLVRKREEFVETVDEHIVRKLPPINETLTKLADVGLFLLREGVFETIRHLENYVLRFAMLFYETFLQKRHFVASFLRSSWNCSRLIGETMPYRVSRGYASDRTPSDKYNLSRASYTQEPVGDSTEFIEAVLVATENTNNPSGEIEPQDSYMSSSGSSNPADALVPANLSSSVPSEKSPPLLPEAIDSRTSGLRQNIFPIELMEVDTEMGPNVCTLEGCRNKSFSSHCNLLRHQRDCHPELGKRQVFTCGENGCDFKSLRKGNMERHRWRVHKIPTVREATAKPVRGMRRSA